MKIIAFYLPQYHPIAENNEWWGEGFTEWTNVAKARPSYSGHYQPHIPSDLGFYDLRLEETRITQAKLAQEYGLGGFCYYHYWFNGKLLLERPFNEVLLSGKPNFPFCLCWANENWTRRWDGKEKEVLIEQNYAEYNPKEHMEWLSTAFADHRYIKVNGKPLFLVYRASDIPNLKEIISVWRETAKSKGLPGIYICPARNSQNVFSDEEIIEAGFDAIYEFEPNIKGYTERLNLTGLPGLNVISYRDLIKDALKKGKNKDITVFPCVFPSWDNSARRRNEATIIQNEDEVLYKEWLKHAVWRIEDNQKDEQIVFINAWNEWGEGCHLEPDLKHGRKFLEATRQVLLENGKMNQMNDVNRKAKRNYISEISYGTEKLSNTPVYYEINIKRPLYVWGTGSSGKASIDLLRELNVSVEGFLDSNPLKWGNCIETFMVYSPEEVLNTHSKADTRPYIIIASMYDDEITPILEARGFNNQVDYAVNISNYAVTMSTASGNERLIVRSARKPICNICGYAHFASLKDEETKYINRYRCKKCGSLPPERMVIQVLSEDIGMYGLPLLEWPPDKNLKLLNIGENDAYAPFLKMVCDFYTNSNRKEELSDFKNEFFDSVLLTGVTSLSAEEIKVIGQSIFRVLKECGILVVGYAGSYDNEKLVEEEFTDICNIFKDLSFQVGVVVRDYPINNINYQRIICARKC